MKIKLYEYILQLNVTKSKNQFFLLDIDNQSNQSTKKKHNKKMIQTTKKRFF